MGFNRKRKLLWGFVLLSVMRCASPAPTQKAEWEKRNRQLQQQLSDSESEMRRLHRLIAPELPAESNEVADAVPTPKVPLAVLRPALPLKPEVDEEEAFFERRRVIANSSHESMTFYHQGMDLMQGGKFDEAVSAFTRFLRAEPEHVYADRAQFSIGECHFRNREYALAVVSYNLVVSRYPQSVKVPEAMYQAALSHLSMGQPKPAKGLLQDLLRQYPMDGLTGPASRKLAEMAGGSSPI